MNHLESDLQIACIEWCNWNTGKYPMLKYIYHSPNGGSRNVREATRFKAEGVKAGVPDLYLPYANKGYHGLYLELKAGKNKLSGNQEEWRDYLKEHHYQWVEIRTLEQFITTIKDYIKG